MRCARTTLPLEYGFEELVAELGATFLCSLFGISSNIEINTVYLASWIEILKEEPNILWKAASTAQKAFDYLLK
ncbi:zincin-like metallopeptidase domain-containing protein [Entomobacter blattae]|uniref:zincin-like metallopeptidase domain-containing protein n=1 Tax=Entomobacter blattae TaxID=2762277 RepID=UPI0038CF4612